MQVKPVPFFTGALFRRQTCFVALPDDYDQRPERRYPVLYLLHGLHGSESDWWLKGEAPQTVQRLIDERQLKECIVVMPNDGGHGLGTFYANWHNGSGAFEDYMVEDLIPFIDQTFRAVPKRRSRAVCGLSMGGYGAVMLALKHPDLFGSAASLSGALGDLSKLPLDHFRRTNWAEIFGSQYGAHARQYNIFRLAELRKSEGNEPHIHMNCGQEDYLFGYNEAFHQYMESIGYEHSYMVFPGAHTWEYWRERLPAALRAIARHWTTNEP